MKRAEISGKKGEHAEKPVAQKLKPGARGETLNRMNAGLYASALSLLEQTQRPTPITSHLQASPILKEIIILHQPTLYRSGLSRIQAKLGKKEEELKVSKVRFEILQYYLNFLREELQGCYREDPAGEFDETRERLEDIATAIRSNPVGSEVANRNLSVKMGKPSEAGPDKSVSFTSIPEWGEHYSPEYSPVKFEEHPFSVFSKLNCYTNFFKIFKSGEFSSRSSPQSTGSNIDTTSRTNQEQPSSGEFYNANIQQASGDNSATIASRELALTTVRQNQLIPSKINRRQEPHLNIVLLSPVIRFPFALPTEIPTLNNIFLIFPYLANIVLFLTLLVAIASTLAAGLMSDKERKMCG